MAKLTSLINTLLNSGLEDLVRSGENLQLLIDTGFPEHRTLVEKQHSYIVRAEIDTDWDFEIDGNYDLKIEFAALERNEAIKKLVEYLTNADYNLVKMPYYVKNATYFKEEYVGKTLDELKDANIISKGGNWNYKVTVYEPESLQEGYIKPDPIITLGGVDYEI